MKKRIIFVVIIFITNYLVGQNFNIDGKYPFQEDSLLSMMTIVNDTISIKYENPPIKKDDLVLSYNVEYIDGISFIKLSEKMPAEIANWYDFEHEDTIQTDDKLLFLAAKEKYTILFFFTKGYPQDMRPCSNTRFNEFGSIYTDCSSHLKENNNEYPVENLSKLVPATPWVEAAPGYGIGEGFTICRAEYSGKTDYLFIINGFISYDKPYLYKQNGRVKKIKIWGLKSGKERILDVLDTQHPQTVDVSFITENEDIRVTIQDVYPGTKYEDTCIHYMINYDEEVIPYEESLK